MRYRGKRRTTTWFDRLRGTYWVGNTKHNAWCSCGDI